MKMARYGLLIVLGGLILMGFDFSKHSVPVEEIESGGPPRDGIPALLHPKFIPAAKASFLEEGDRVLGIVDGKEAKAYPIKILNWHEVINDTINSRPVVISYCPLCGTGMAFDAMIHGKQFIFGVSGLLYNSDVLMYDHQTESLWSQIKRAVTVRLKADPSNVAPGATAQFTLRLTNSGAGHYIPTGDPDRYFTIEFQIVDAEGRVLKEQTETIGGRWIVWQPVIWEVYGNRLKPLENRDYTFRYRLPASAEKSNGLQFRAVLRYHIQTEKAHEMLKTRYGLTANDPYKFTIFEHEAPLPGTFTDVLQKGWEPDLPEQQLRNDLACAGNPTPAGAAFTGLSFIKLLTGGHSLLH